METRPQEEFLALEKERSKLKKKIDMHLFGVVIGAFMIGSSLLLLVYHTVTTLQVETQTHIDKSLGFFLAIGGGFLSSSSAKKKKQAERELMTIEQQLP